MMVITICVLAIALVFFTFLTVYLFYGMTHLEGQRDALQRDSQQIMEIRNLCQQLVNEKFDYYLPCTERALTEEIFKSRKERGEL